MRGGHWTRTTVRQRGTHYKTTQRGQRVKFSGRALALLSEHLAPSHNTNNNYQRLLNGKQMAVKPSQECHPDWKQRAVEEGLLSMKSVYGLACSVTSYWLPHTACLETTHIYCFMVWYFHSISQSLKAEDVHWVCSYLGGSGESAPSPSSAVGASHILHSGSSSSPKPSQ